MKTIRVENFGGPEVMRLTEAPTPVPGAGQLLIRLRAAGVNPVETYIRSGKYGQLPALPYTPGTDGAGTVEDAGSRSDLQPGQHVYVAGSVSGTYAEYCVCEPQQVHALPETVSFNQGAAIGVPYATAYRALFQRGRARAGETVLVHGGTGGVGLAAIQLAVGAGLRVLTTGGSEAGRVLARQQGADKVYDHHAISYAQAILDDTDGKGVDLIVELLANVNLGRDLTMLARRGRVAVVGSRGPVEINPRETMVREADILGVMVGAASPEESAEAHRALGEGLREGKLLPVVGKQFPLADAAAAHEAVMGGGAGGKLALII